MGWLTTIVELFKGGKSIAKVISQGNEDAHEENMADIDLDKAALMQFAAEFHQRKNRNKWDSFVDGLNRLPRPLMAIVVLGFFVLAPVNPEYFTKIAEAYKIVPDGYWALLSVIIGFYFGGRMQLKSQDMTMKKSQVHAAKELVALRQGFRKLETEEESPQAKMFAEAIDSGLKTPVNKVVSEWLKSR